MTSRAKTDDTPIPGALRWDVSWDEVDQAQLMTMLAATPAQRLAWLEEAMRLAYASGAIRENCGSQEGHEANQGTESSSDNLR